MNPLVNSMSASHSDSASHIYWWVVSMLSPDWMSSQSSKYLNPTSCVSSPVNELEKWIQKNFSLSAVNITYMIIYHIWGSYPFPWIKTCMLLLKPWVSDYISTLFLSFQMMSLLCMECSELLLAYWKFTKLEVWGIAKPYFLQYVISCHSTIWGQCIQGRRVVLDIFGIQRQVFCLLRLSLYFFEVGYIALGISVLVSFLPAFHLSRVVCSCDLLLIPTDIWCLAL